MYVLIGLAIVLTILVSIYFYYYIYRTLTFWYKGKIKWWMRVLVILCVVLLAIGCINPFGITALVLYYIFGISIVLDVVSGILYIVKKLNHKQFYVWNRVWRCGLVPVLLAIAVLIYGHIHMLDIREKTYGINTEKQLDASEGYKVAFLSDLHFPTTMNGVKLKKYCDEIEAQDPDFVILGGDIVDERTTKKEMELALQLLGDIRTKYGVFYVYGNHDSARYSESADFTIDDLNYSLKKNGIRCLADETYEINDDLLLVGRKDVGYGGSSFREETQKLLEIQDKNRFILLLDHQPVELKQNADAGVDLQLSGHTHGGQIWPVGLISDILGFGEMNYGEKQIENYRIIVSSGIAGWGYSIRTGHNSEYLMVNIY